MSIVLTRILGLIQKTRRGLKTKGKQLKRRRKEKKIILPYIPRNIMEEIFHKLPYIAMGRSKLVCKEWNAIISCPKFMDDHYNYCRLIDGNNLIVLSHYEKSGVSVVYTSSYSNLVKEQSLSSVRDLEQQDLPDSPNSIKQSVLPRILGSYNGLVAILWYNNLILWNPLTKKDVSVHTEMHDPFENYGYFNWGDRLLYGLCYDGGRDEYSVVVGSNIQHPPVSLANFNDGTIIWEKFRVYLHSFKDGRKRKRYRDSLNVRLLDDKLFDKEIGKVICGLPHWVANIYDFTDPVVKTAILYFDLKDERFKQMTCLGDFGGDKTMLGLATTDDENQLGCVLHDVISSSLEVWVMKEYGKSESWTNLFTIPYLNVTKKLGSISYMTVMGFMPNGELLLYLNGGKLRIYDVEKGKYREIKFGDVEFENLTTYQPKLISPPEPLKGFEQKEDDRR